MSAVKLHLLGAPQLERDGEPVSVDTRKALALLAYMVMTAAGGAPSHTRDALAALLWPELDQSRARAALRRTLSPLRQVLDHRVLDVTRDTVSIGSDASLWVDALEFRRLVSAAAAHAHRDGLACDDCRRLLEQAVALYGDDFMAGFSLRDAPDFDEWSYFEAEHLRRALGSVLEQLTQSYTAIADYKRAIAAARRHLALDPLAEQAHRNLMQLHAWSGQRSLAVRQYRDCVRVLEQELGVPPLEETTALYEMILADELPAPERLQTTDRRRPEGTQIAQIRNHESQDHQRSIPSPDDAPSAVHRPPSLAVPLVGREPEWVRMQVAYGAARERGHLLVLEGEAGVGKTRLAEEFVAQAQGRLLQARSYEGESNLTFSPFIAALRKGLENAPDNWREHVPEAWLAEAARLLPELSPNATPPEPLVGPGAQSRFFEAICVVLLALTTDLAGPERGLSGFQKAVSSAATHPGILFFDDVHWTDEASLDLLAYLVKRLANYPLLVLVTWRGESLPAGHRLQALLAGAQRANAGTHVVLHRLNVRHVEALVDAVLAAGYEIPARLLESATLGQRLYEETEGLPFFVVEYLKAALSLPEDGDEPGKTSGEPVATPSSTWEMPPGVRGLLQSRLDGLDEISWQLLNTAAIIGRSFDFDTCRLASGRSEEEAVPALENLLARGLIEEVRAHGAQRDMNRGALPASAVSTPQYDFSHNQMRALVYQETSLARRRLLHRRVAEALALRAPVASQAAQVAHHYRLAGEDSQAAAYFWRAAVHARELYANSAALEHLLTALALGHPDAAALHEAIGDLYTLLGEYGDALISYEAAAAHAPGVAGDQARLEQKLGSVHHRCGEWRLAESHFRAALAMLEASAGDDDARNAARARIYADWSLTAHHQGASEQAWSLAQKAHELAQADPEGATLAQAHNILGILARHGADLPAAERHLQRSLDLATGAGLRSERIAALNNLALVYGEASGADEPSADSLARAQATLNEALQLCQELGDRHREAALHNNLADLHHSAGRSDEAMAHLKRAATIFAEIGGDAQAWQPEIWKLTEW